jgi:hypothetical protein
VNLLYAIERHLRQTGMSPSRLGRELFNDSSLVRDLRNGRELRPHTEAKLHDYLIRQGLR